MLPRHGQFQNPSPLSFLKKEVASRGMRRSSMVWKSTQPSIAVTRHPPSNDGPEPRRKVFRFAVKIPKEITHERATKDIRQPFEIFLQDISALGGKRGPLLCQLPPSLRFDLESFDAAFDTMRTLDQGPIVIEVRHRSWASEQAIALLQRYSIDRVLADPALVWPASDFRQSPRYVRLHGKPKVYYSKYTDAEIDAFSKLLGPDSWCVFDNTASGAAIENALTMLGRR